MSKLGSWIKSQRLSKGWTQIEMAKKLGLRTAQAIGNIERGAAPFPQERVMTLCETLSVNSDLVIRLLVSDYEDRVREKMGLRIS